MTKTKDEIIREGKVAIAWLRVKQEEAPDRTTKAQIEKDITERQKAVDKLQGFKR